MFCVNNILVVINIKIKFWLELFKGFDLIIKYFLLKLMFILYVIFK